jgi:PAS domain S-box-containing protein
MLAEFVAQHPEIARDVEAQTGASEPMVLRKANGNRLRAMLKELVDTLHHGHLDQHPGWPSGADGGSLRDRELLREGILEKLEQDHINAPDEEVKLLSDWVWGPDHVWLSESNRYTSTLLDLSPDAVAVVSLEGRILYANRATAKLVHGTTGLSPEQLIGRTGRDVGLWVEAGPRPREFQEIARSRAVAEVQMLGHWYELRAREIVGPDGKVQALGITLTDIHDRKLALVRLELLSKLNRIVGTIEGDDLWRALAQVPVPQLADWCTISVIERDQVRSSFLAQRDPSKTHLRDTILRAATGMKHHPLWQELNATGFQLLSEVSDELLHTLAPTDELYELVRQLEIRSLMVVPVVSRGDTIAIFTFAFTAESKRRYDHNDPALAIEVALHAAHLAEHARLIAETKTSEARFRVALSDARTLVYEQDENLRYVWHYSSHLPVAPVGRVHSEILPAAEAEVLTRLKEHVLQTGDALCTELELSFGGVTRWYRETIEAVQDPTGRRTGVIGAATDFTEQKRIQEELKTAVELRERVMGILGHDLRNPLAAVNMAATSLVRREDLPPDAQRTAARIERGARRMNEMIETLLDFTRVRVSGQPLPITRNPSDLGEAAREIVEELRLSWPDRAIELEVHGDTQEVLDAPRMAQVISNLIANALTYGDPTRPIGISVDGDREALSVRVHNEGPPIPRDLVPVLFDPFTRGQADVISPQGLGLGLFVVREIVGSHGGSIGVESTETEGTTFTIRLPRGRAPC